jgi:uncharacterized membrane protein (UPF0127 family)
VARFTLKGFEPADTFGKRMLGIMFRRRLRRPMLFSFPKESVNGSAIHSFFCFVDFDAVFLDSKRRVVDVKPRVKPFTPLISPKSPARFLIEAPAGWAGKNKIRVGMLVSFARAKRKRGAVKANARKNRGSAGRQAHR